MGLTMTYDYLVVGSGLYGAVFAYEANKRGKKVLVLERRNHIGGNVYCENKDNINIHVYGAHIFHTSNIKIWQYVKQFVKFNNFINSPLANYKGEVYNLPFNMNTYNKLWGITNPKEAKAYIEKQKSIIKRKPTNLEEQAISLVGIDVYEKLIKGYTEKQWGRSCQNLPAFIINRIPVRYTYNNNYFNDPFQGIPIGGYNSLINKLLENIEVKLNTNFLDDREKFASLAKRIIYTGAIDEYFEYKLGYLEYRGLKFKTEKVDTDNYQGVAVMNFTDCEIEYTRIIEHKHFEDGDQPITYITKEYPKEWKPGEEAYYPINNERNQFLYREYKKLANKESHVIFGGRLAEYVYYDMDKVIQSSLIRVQQELDDEY